MLESKAYQKYYAFASGKKAPKPKYIRKKVDSDTSPKKKPVQATKGTTLKTLAKVAKSDKKKQPAKMPKAKGLNVLSEDADEESDVNDDSEETKSDNDGDNLTYPTLSTYKTDDEEEEEDKTDNEEEEEEKADNDEIYSDQRVFTPPKYELTDEDEENQEGDDQDMEGEHEQDDEDDLYRDVNINLERSDVEMTNAQANQDTEYSHVILTPVPPIVQQQISSVSSDLVSEFFNPSPDTSIDSILSPNIQSHTLVNVPVSITAETPSFDTTIPPLHIPIIQPLQQTQTP
ncbi:hypothetical protein Tco_0702344 [Tanacetum coccineum]|uniref:Uncharacterized protein n=1 Tax=Tanacetum coccineum TaxID=301880 RepID=A0ABQ4XX87_9ASTR